MKRSWFASLAALTAACSSGSDEAARYVHLASSFTPAPIEDAEWAEPVGGGPRLRLFPDPEGKGAWLAGEIPGEEWERTRVDGVWAARRPLPGTGQPPDGAAPLKLQFREGSYSYGGGYDPTDVAPGHFYIAGARLMVAVGEGKEHPGSGTLVEFIDRGGEENDRWRVSLGAYHADGIPVLPGKEERVRAAARPNSALRFATTTRGQSPHPSGVAGTVTFRVLLDGEEIFSAEQDVGASARSVRREVALPTGGLDDAELMFAVDGGAAFAAFHCPVIGPADVGSYEERPWGQDRPDLILFLADTFRADNMATYGGDPRISPNLDRFARDSAVFTQAWSTGSWTLPSHATMLSGLFPYQTGVIDQSTSLPHDAVTIAEKLAEVGYRTGAITDKGFVSRSYGLAQGFEWFREKHLRGLDSVRSTLREVERFLDADDGRPIFLFVQSYRAHVPYVVHKWTREKLGEHLGLGRTYDELLEVAPLDLHSGTQTAPPPELQAIMREFQALYRGASHDMDRGFEQVRRQLDERSILGGGYVVFTSDHGEAFWEHGPAGHGNGLWEEYLRIPLMIQGPDVTKGPRDYPVSLVDIPSTLAALARVPEAADWLGRDLTKLDTERTIVSFECNEENGTPVAFIEGRRKVIVDADIEAFERSSLRHAYDLATDPEEKIDLARENAAWPEELLRELGPAIGPLLVPQLGPGKVHLDPESRAQLDRLGYAGK